MTTPTAKSLVQIIREAVEAFENKWFIVIRKR
jgi:hypothetical protein